MATLSAVNTSRIAARPARRTAGRLVCGVLAVLALLLPTGVVYAQTDGQMAALEAFIERNAELLIGRGAWSTRPTATSRATCCGKRRGCMNAASRKSIPDIPTCRSPWPSAPGSPSGTRCGWRANPSASRNSSGSGPNASATCTPICWTGPTRSETTIALDLLRRAERQAVRCARAVPAGQRADGHADPRTRRGPPATGCARAGRMSAVRSPWTANWTAPGR